MYTYSVLKLSYPIGLHNMSKCVTLTYLFIHTLSGAPNFHRNGAYGYPFLTTRLNFLSYKWVGLLLKCTYKNVQRTKTTVVQTSLDKETENRISQTN